AGVYQGRLSAAYPSYLEGPLARTHFIIGRDEGATPPVSRTEIEAGITAIVRTWADDLRTAAVGDPATEKLIRRHGERFRAAYREAFDVKDAIVDMGILDRLTPERPRLVDLYRREGEEPERANLKVFSHGAAVTLSERVPMLEGLGFRVVSERTFKLSPPSDAPPESARAWLHDMALERAAGGAIDIETVDPRIEAALMALFHGLAESDRLNALVLEAGIGWRETAMLRTLSRYAQQIRAPYGQDYIAETLKTHAGIAAKLVELFHARFDPRVDAKGRDKRQAEVSDAIEQMLGGVQSLDEDRILRLFRSLIMAAVRTNFFQLGPDGRPREVIAFKFEAAKIPNLPLPKPLFEIFLHSPRVEGVHMRFGKVARGGIRWSDRPQDFRTEVLGLVKAQQVKNAVIVPVGSKGGFYPTQLPRTTDREAIQGEAIRAYRTFLSGLLDITDNIAADGAVTHPANVIAWEGDD
ncbi:MAG: NAD-glutamate dehydrogenase domain-containing protein, partial [Beijerinckiaceae bacterium]